MSAWQWHKVMPAELAKFITRDCVRWVVLPVDREAVVRSGGRLDLVRAIYNALASAGVRYAPERYNPSAPVQEIRQPSEVLDKPREGTCLDLASVFCGVCEGNDLLPMIIVLKTHALAAVGLKQGMHDWDAYGRVEQQLFETGVLTDPEALLQLFREGSHVPVECTGFTRQPQATAPTGPVPPRLTFDEAVKDATERVNRPGEFKFAIDVAIARWSWMIESAAADVEQAVAAGQHVDANRLIELMTGIGNRRAVDRFVEVAATKLGASEQNFRVLAGEPPNDAVGNQATALADARRALAGQGARTTADSELQLGRLAALRRDYDEAEEHLRAAVQLAPQSSAAAESFLWLSQSRAMQAVQRGDTASATKRLEEAERLARKYPAVDPAILNLRGYIFKTLAQAAEMSGSASRRASYLARASACFEAVLASRPDDASALNGRANVKHMLSDLVGAKRSYLKAIRVAPDYAAAHHDLALLFEDWAEARPTRKTHFLSEALGQWRECRTYAKRDPQFSVEDLAAIHTRVKSLDQLLKARPATRVAANLKPGRGRGIR
jgi:tetratricopeptide (TPR) repeat protein